MTPKAVVVVSGKRKSGKDYLSSQLNDRLGPDKCVVLHLSGPLKHQYAEEHGLDLTRLLDASEYKENYRADMIRWGEEKRNLDPGFFCKLATSGEGCDKEVWVVCDARRKSDLHFFKTFYGAVTLAVRVECGLDVRQQRGFIYTQGVDDAESECGLDVGVDWDVIVTNNGSEQEFNEGVQCLIDLISNKLNNINVTAEGTLM